MSQELNMILNKAAMEDRERKEMDLAQGVDRYKSILLALANDKKMDVVYSVEGAETRDSKKKDFKMLEKAGLIKGETKYTHRNEYRQFQLTPQGAELVQKLAKER